MKLESIGFYTLSDVRAETASHTSPLSRCELVLTDACNFRCAYCRGLPRECGGTMPLEQAKAIVSEWASHGLRNVRFSGGEPTCYKGIVELVEHARASGVDRIALSTNGSSPLGLYKRLLAAGVSDLSISLDACCAADGDELAGGVSGAWEQVVANIRALAPLTYVTVGIVLTASTVAKVGDLVAFAHGLGVADIRVIPAAQLSTELAQSVMVDEEVLAAHPILRYRISNAKAGRPVRGLQSTDSPRCRLVLDDMAVAGEFHYPCIIYLREQGQPIGRMRDIASVREERRAWSEEHYCFSDPICRRNCLDVCVQYNNHASLARRRLPVLTGSNHGP